MSDRRRFSDRAGHFIPGTPRFSRSDTLVAGVHGPTGTGIPEANPFRKEPDPAKKSLSEVQRLLPPYFEMGTVYTMIAGLLNILAIYDACCGPVPGETAKKEDEPDANPLTEGEEDKP